MDPVLMINHIMDRLGCIIEPDDIPLVRATAEDLLKRGFSADDAVRYLRCMEEVNPDYPEDKAIRRMKELMEKYGGTR